MKLRTMATCFFFDNVFIGKKVNVVLVLIKQCLRYNLQTAFTFTMLGLVLAFENWAWHNIFPSDDLSKQY